MSEIVQNRNKEKIDPVEIFVGAVANEMNRDRYVFLKSPVSQFNNIVIPRLEKLNYLANTYPRSLACIACLSSKLWSLFLYPVLLLLQVTLALRHISFRKVKIAGDIFLSTSKTSFIFSRSSGFDGVHICLSRKLKQSYPSKNLISSIEDHIVATDIARAFLQAMRALFRLRKSGDIPGIVFQVYAAFGWFVTWSVLSRNADGLTSVWMSSDSDRWAVLIDQLPTVAKKIIVQHGLLSDPPNQLGFRNPASLPKRLENINKIILFDRGSEDNYRSQVIATNCNTSFIYSGRWLIQSPSDLDCRYAVRVMIIGQRVHLDQECELANYLAETVVNSRIYVKPHPSSTLAQYKKRLDFRVVLIEDLFMFPLVELCIAFDFSSLGYLYEKQGAEVIYLTEIKNDCHSREEIRDKASDLSGQIKKI
jgi:hypothetical protein